MSISPPKKHIIIPAIKGNIPPNILFLLAHALAPNNNPKEMPETIIYANISFKVNFDNEKSITNSPTKLRVVKNIATFNTLIMSFLYFSNFSRSTPPMIIFNVLFTFNTIISNIKRNTMRNLFLSYYNFVTVILHFDYNTKYY